VLIKRVKNTLDLKFGTEMFYLLLQPVTRAAA